MTASLLPRWWLLAFLLFVSCGDGSSGMPAPSDAGAPSRVPASAPGPELDIPGDAPLVAFLGDSLSAGLHLAKSEAFPALLQRQLAKAGRPVRILNAGVSGSTTAAGLARVDWILGQQPDLVVIQLGANDGFRGIALETVRENLTAIVERIKQAGARPVLLEMRLPPNYGEQYAAGFVKLYARVAEATGAEFIPFFMDGVAGRPEMNLPDGIHPTPEGHRRLAENLQAPFLELLREK
jgi:acyl-CoA thioesterase-1